MIGKTISHYKILEELGRGGMGTVFTPLDKRAWVFRNSIILSQQTELANSVSLVIQRGEKHRTPNSTASSP